MCKASIGAERTVDAVHGQTLGIGVSTHGLAAFHAPGVPATNCVVCVKDGTIITLSSIPPKLQLEFDVGERAVAMFIDKGDNKHDAIAFENGKEVRLYRFLNSGVYVYIGELAAGTEADMPALDIGITSTRPRQEHVAAA